MTTMTGAPTWSIRKNLILLAGMSAEEAYHWIKENYFRFCAWVVFISVGVIATGAIFNAVGLYSANLILAAICLLAGAVLAAQPIVLGCVYATGKNLTGAKTRTEAMSIYIKAIAHILLFASLVFMVLASVRIESYWAFLFLFVALAAAGMLSIAGSVPPKIYYTVTTVMVLGFVILSFFNMLAYQHAQDSTIAEARRGDMVRYDDSENAEMEKFNAITDNGGMLTPAQRVRRNQIMAERDARTGHRGLINSVLDSGTVTVGLWDAKPKTIGDFPPGYVTITVNPRQVTIDGVNYWIEDYVRINGKNPKDGPILIDADHKAVMTIDFNTAGIANTRFDSEQRLAIEYKKAPL